MKKIILFSVLFITALSSFAQTTIVQQPLQRKIEVSGFSEMEVVPDELYFSISLREYFNDEKNQKDKVIISTLEKQLIKAIAEAGLPKEALSISGVGGYQNYVDKKKKPATFLENKQYELKIDRADKLDAILSKVESRGIQYANIARVDHSKKEEFKKQVKINALKAAKDKAAYLLEAVDQKLGPVLEIREVEDNINYPQPMYAKANMRMMAASESADAVQDSDVQYQKIKISYRMQAVFEIK
ncbi:SIMPL domain-containing protein [Dyadobacter subterraneus]|uniref:SIMPL domain-containing protein n=1 Tax=Dyadobacter subterraneus TaxID=2773304 RepID=A0ABR9WKK3_9BACT|nr:SIMPL domain-containing protein [Dyadobacter subterraneus]MBE9466048.1 SIMPL domain-containing protein [Dyadobacter subterraneus]